jgi:hypothetical protein
MAKRGGSGKVSFQALCTPPDPSSVSFAAFEKQLLDAKAHLMALRPASADQVAEIMMATQLHAFLIKGAADGPQRYQGPTAEYLMLLNKNWTKLANLDLSLWCRCKNLASRCK